nr:hypothetical protein OG690_38610 [Streptomyces tubercidicus]
MTEIPEEAEAKALRAQAAALRAVSDAGARRAELLRQADEILTDEVKPLALAAARAGAERSRIRQEARVGTRLLYQWLEEAGFPVRAKKRK